MTSRDSKSSQGPSTFFGFGQERAEAAVALQKDLMQAYEIAGSAWLARMKFELELWSDLAAKLAATRSPAEAIENYTKCVSQQVQMTMEDSKHLFDDYQQFTQKIAQSFSNGGAARSST